MREREKERERERERKRERERARERERGEREAVEKEIYYIEPATYTVIRATIASIVCK